MQRNQASIQLSISLTLGSQIKIVYIHTASSANEGAVLFCANAEKGELRQAEKFVLSYNNFSEVLTTEKNESIMRKIS